MDEIRNKRGIENRCVLLSEESLLSLDYVRM